jgi:putative transposase
MKATPYRGFRFPKAIIQHATWLYLRFPLSLRDVEELLAERGIIVPYETIRVWVARFGPLSPAACGVGEVARATSGTWTTCS